MVDLSRVRTRPVWLAAPWRLRCDLNADPLTLYTVQSVASFELLRSEGELRGHPASADEDFADAYTWLSVWMTELLGEHGIDEGAVWLWAAETRAGLVGQLRAVSSESMLLTVSIARERVLLTDFDDWHDILNRRLHVPAQPGESPDEWWARAEPLMNEWHERTHLFRNDPLDAWPDECREELEASWLPIINPGPSPGSEHVQAVARVLRPEDVVDAVRVGARRGVVSPQEKYGRSRSRSAGSHTYR